MSPERPEDDDFLEDEEQEEYGQRSIFATGWFRAVLVLLVLAVIAVIAVPLIGGWFEPTPPPKVTTTRPVEPTPAPLPTPAAHAAARHPGPGARRRPRPSCRPPRPRRRPPGHAGPGDAAAGGRAPRPRGPRCRPPRRPAGRPRRRRRPSAPPPRAASKSASKPAAAAGGSYWVQVGAFKESKNAEGLARTLRSEGFTVQVAQRDARRAAARRAGRGLSRSRQGQPRPAKSCRARAIRVSSRRVRPSKSTRGGDGADQERSDQRGGGPRAVEAAVGFGGGVAVRHHLPLLREG